MIEHRDFACLCGGCGGAFAIDDQIIKGLNMLDAPFTVQSRFSCHSDDRGVDITSPNLERLFNDAVGIFDHVCRDGRILNVNMNLKWHIWDDEIYLAKDFAAREYVCNCSHCRELQLAPMQQSFVDKLQCARDRHGGPIILSRGYSCPKHNASIPGAAPDSQHQYGRAGDVDLLDGELLGHLFKGIILHDTYTHVDDRDTPYFSDRRTT